MKMGATVIFYVTTGTSTGEEEKREVHQCFMLKKVFFPETTRHFPQT
jgi:hypothetical protein